MDINFLEEQTSIVEREHNNRCKRKRGIEPTPNYKEEFQTLKPISKEQPPSGLAKRIYYLDPFVVDPSQEDVVYVFESLQNLKKIDKHQITTIATFKEINNSRIYGLGILDNGTLIATQQRLIIEINPITRQVTEALSLEHLECCLGAVGVDIKCNIVYVQDTQSYAIFKWNRTSNKLSVIKYEYPGLYNTRFKSIRVDPTHGDLLLHQDISSYILKRNHWLDWDVARLLWIGKMKDTQFSPFGLLPRELVLEIIKFASYYR